MSIGSSDSRKPVLQPSELGKLVQLKTCPRFFKFNIEETGFSEIQHNITNFKETVQSGNIVEKKAGYDFEQQVVEDLKSANTRFLNLEDITLNDWETIIPDKDKEPFDPIDWFEISDERNDPDQFHGLQKTDVSLSNPESVASSIKSETGVSIDETSLKSYFFSLKAKLTEYLITSELTQTTESTPDSYFTDNRSTASDPVVLFQPTLGAEINGWTIAGDADLIIIWNADDPTSVTEIRVIDVKVASEEQTHHQIQTAAYAHAIQQLDLPTEVKHTVNTGVLTHDKSYLPPTQEKLPQFDKESRIADLRRLTKDDGPIDTAFACDFADVDYQLDSKCSSCQYNEVCYTTAVENAGLELLNIPSGMQHTLREHGVNDLNELAALAENVDEATLEPKGYDNVHPKKADKPPEMPGHRDTYNSLATEPSIGEDLPSLIQQAQALLSKINPSHPRATKRDVDRHITNTGYGSLPTDAYFTSDEYLSGSMIRVYINVQYDHINERILALAFHARATASDADAITWAQSLSQIPDDPTAYSSQEFNLLDEFAESIHDAIETIDAGISYDDVEQSNPFLQLYTYTEEESQILKEKITKYSNAATSPSQTPIPETYLLKARNLVDGKYTVEPDPIAVISTDIKERIALSIPTTGIVNVYDRFFPSRRPEEAFNVTDWEYTVSNDSRFPSSELPKTINLKEVFSHRLFDNSEQYTQSGDAIYLLLDESYSTNADGWYTHRIRTGSQIPLPYFWAASGRMTDQWVRELKAEDPTIAIAPYRYHSSKKKQTEITTNDIEALMKRITECLRHIEQGIPEKSLIKTPKNEA